MKEFAVKAISLLPDYFYEIPASSTAKYHSKSCLGRSGLVRHTKAATMIAKDLYRIGIYDEMFSDREKQMVIIALILHDGLKCGMPKEKYTCDDHPLLMADLILSDIELNSILQKDELDIITSAIRSHMGIWNKSYKTKKEILPVPKTNFQWFVHLCDYLASRSYLQYDFGKDNFILDENNEVQDSIDQIVKTCKKKIEEGADREQLLNIISTENSGNKNPNSITSLKVANKILEKIGDN
ncbi:MAG: hypothetical protein RSC97_10900 [Eubacterium sp.]